MNVCLSISRSISQETKKEASTNAGQLQTGEKT